MTMMMMMSRARQLHTTLFFLLRQTARVGNGIKFPEPGDACQAVFVFSELPRLWRLNLHVLSEL